MMRVRDKAFLLLKNVQMARRGGLHRKLPTRLITWNWTKHCYKTLKYASGAPDSTCAFSNLRFPYGREGFSAFWEEIGGGFPQRGGAWENIFSLATRAGTICIPIGPDGARTLHAMARRLRRRGRTNAS